MLFKSLTTTLALASAVSAAAIGSRQTKDCQADYSACIATKPGDTNQVTLCKCILQSCSGEEPARLRDFCASATAYLHKPTPTPTPTPAKIDYVGEPVYQSPSPTPAKINYVGELVYQPAQSPSPTPAKINYVGEPVYQPAQSPSPPPAGVHYPSAKLVSPPQHWTIDNLIRYCGEGNNGCEYNFNVTFSDGSLETCSISRTNIPSAASESFTDVGCTKNSKTKISWGYVAEPHPAFAVITVKKEPLLAWFGASDINGEPVTPQNPFGSKHFAKLGPEPVYTFQ